MPIIPLMPFRTPAANSVRVDLSLVAPAVAESQLSSHWDRSINLHVRALGFFRQSFWSETGIDPTAAVQLSFTAVCRATKREWNARAAFHREEGGWTARCDLELGGAQLAGDAELRASIVGPGRTESPDPGLAIHRGAKLWSARPHVLRLEPSEGLFPVTAVSFQQTSRRPTIWAVEEVGATGPAAHISESLRLFVNSDLDEGLKLAAGKSSMPVLSSVRTDIQMRTLAVLSGFFDDRSPNELLAVADSHRGSIAAMGRHTATEMGMTLDEMLRDYRENPLSLQDRIRAQNHYLQDGARA